MRKAVITVERLPEGKLIQGFKAVVTIKRFSTGAQEYSHSKPHGLFGGFRNRGCGRGKEAGTSTVGKM